MQRRLLLRAGLAGLLATPAWRFAAQGAQPAGTAAADGAAGGASAGGAKPVQDSIGRPLTLSAPLSRIWPAGAPAALLLFSLAPDTMLGWPGARPKPDQLAQLPDLAAQLPELPRLTGHNAPDAATIQAHHPGLILDYGATTSRYRALADRVAQETGLPYALLDGRLAEIPSSYRRLGEILAAAPQHQAAHAAAAQLLAQNAQALLEEVSASAARLAAHRPRVLCLAGPAGDTVEFTGGPEDDILAFAGAEPLGQAGATISVDQVAALQPDWIIATDPAFAAHAARDATWQALPAVAAGHLVTAPNLPFGWLGHPPSVNRLMGLVWLPALFASGGDVRAGSSTATSAASTSAASAAASSLPANSTRTATAPLGPASTPAGREGLVTRMAALCETLWHHRPDQAALRQAVAAALPPLR